MSPAQKAPLLVIIRRAPYDSSLARSALDTALASAALEQPVRVLFLGEGVLQLLPGQDSAAAGLRNVSRLLSSFPLYDLDRVYADANAVTRHGVNLKDSPVPVRPLAAAQVHALMEEHTHLLGF